MTDASDAPAAKRLKPSGSPSAPNKAEAYKLIYWPGLPGRGEHIRLAFEEAGVDYEDTAKEPDAVAQVLAQISTDNLGDSIKRNPPPCAPPILVHGDLLISQTPNILMYLAPRLGLTPAPDDAIYRVNALALTALDGLSNEVHDCHHPISTALYYEEQKTESVRRSKMFLTHRLPKFLEYFERVLQGNSGQSEWLYGSAVTYADLVLFQCVDGTTHQFPKAMALAKKSGKYDRVFAHHAAVQQRPNIAAYLASDRRAKYGDGIYRYYAPLDLVPDDKEEEK